ncbi:hypothetical protein KP13_04887 [Klebsiella pneumoniae subsp. pneumoniae Kp13]|nr:hypothetical protein KP13_04887 [Klebsiella pneumoniae subsp. pneumoniae Kp13]
MAWDSGLFIFQLVPNHIGVIIASPLNKIKYLPETGPYPVLRLNFLSLYEHMLDHIFR